MFTTVIKKITVMKFFSLFLSLFILISCNNEQPGKNEKSGSEQEKEIKNTLQQPVKTTFHLNMPELIKQEKEVYLSHIAKSIKYVPLETTSEYMIGDKTVKVKPCAEFIFVAEHGKPIGVFDLDGKFLRTIGNIGKGPGEYNFDYGFWPEEGSRKIYITNTNIKGITTYSFTGEYTGDIISEPYAMAFVPLGEDKFLAWHFMQQKMNEQLYRLFFLDKEGAIYSRFYEPKIEYDFTRGFSMNNPEFTYTPDGVLYNSWEDDFILRAKRDGSIEEALTWDLGKYEMPFKPTEDYGRFNREKHKYIFDISALESTEYFFLKYQNEGKRQFALMNKRSEEFTVVMNPDTVQKGVFNDIDGGPSYWPYWYSDNGKRFFGILQAVDLIERAGGAEADIEIRDQVAARKYQDIIAKLNENSNPVLMIVELK